MIWGNFKPYFTKQEMHQLVTSNYYSILFYNSEIWHKPSLHHYCKTQLVAASATGIKLCPGGDVNAISYKDLQVLNKRATPHQLMLWHKYALLLYKLVNNIEPANAWLVLNFMQTFVCRQVCFQTIRSNYFKVGMYLLCNKLAIINKRISNNWLNLSIESYKFECQEAYLS